MAARSRKDCHRSRPVCCIMRSRLSQSALLAIKYHDKGNIFKSLLWDKSSKQNYNQQCFKHYFIYRYQNFKLKFCNNKRKYNQKDRFTYHNLYIVKDSLVVSRGCLMIDYISLSLAVIICLVMWWSFLAVSGLEESWAYGLTNNSSCQQIEAPTPLN